MERFDPEQFLALIEKRRVTVPEHRPPRAAFAAHVRPCPPEEKALAGAEPMLAAYAALWSPAPQVSSTVRRVET